MPVGSEGLRYRGGVAVRALAAILGGYGLSALAAAVIAIALPAVRLEAAVAATMLAFVVYPCAVMWVFAARSAARALLGLALPSAVLGAIVAANQYLGATP
ncbi:iron transporter [Xylophilus sp. GOD-11R]|nr:iron transporter [Xylophilus sp. GOD-11R]WPB59467.1 iron transporter [Xylophilus sp. GOD-11R]